MITRNTMRTRQEHIQTPLLMLHLKFLSIIAYEWIRHIVYAIYFTFPVPKLQ